MDGLPLAVHTQAANTILLRGFAKYPAIPSMTDLFKLQPAAIATYPMYRGLATVGDLLGRLRGRRWMFDSQAFGKLFGSAAYDSSAICRELGFEPKWTFRSALPDMVSAETQTPGRKD